MNSKYLGFLGVDFLYHSNESFKRRAEMAAHNLFKHPFVSLKFNIKIKTVRNTAQAILLPSSLDK